MTANASILVVDDEENLRRTLALILQREGYTVTTAASVMEARECLQEGRFDLVFLDLKLPDASGLTLLPEMRSQNPDLPVLILTAHDKLDVALEAVRGGARDYLLKPIDPPILLARVKEVLAEG
jgi:two-component system, NtrC family, response regulator PilR